MWIKKRYMVLKDYNRVNIPYLERISEGFPQDVMFDVRKPRYIKSMICILFSLEFLLMPGVLIESLSKIYD